MMLLKKIVLAVIVVMFVSTTTMIKTIPEEKTQSMTMCYHGYLFNIHSKLGVKEVLNADGSNTRCFRI